MKKMLPVVAALIAGAIFVWPTPYRYHASNTVRFFRLTGRAEFLHIRDDGRGEWILVCHANGVSCGWVPGDAAGTDPRCRNFPNCRRGKLVEAHKRAIQSLLVCSVRALDAARSAYQKAAEVERSGPETWDARAPVWRAANKAWAAADQAQEDLIRAGGAYIWSDSDHDAQSEVQDSVEHYFSGTD